MNNNVSDTDFYRSTKWRKLRHYILQRDNKLCQRCLMYGLITPAEIVHHKEELTLDNMNNYTIAYNPENLVSLCRNCHEEIHNRKQHRRYKVDDNGDIIDILSEYEDDLLDEERKK